MIIDSIWNVQKWQIYINRKINGCLGVVWKQVLNADVHEESFYGAENILNWVLVMYAQLRKLKNY